MEIVTGYAYSPTRRVIEALWPDERARATIPPSRKPQLPRPSVIRSAATRDGYPVDFWSDGNLELDSTSILDRRWDESVAWLILNHSCLWDAKEFGSLVVAAKEAVRRHERLGGAARGHLGEITGRRLGEGA